MCKKSTKDGAIFSLTNGEHIANKVDYFLTEDGYSDSEDESDLDEGREGADRGNEEDGNDDEEPILEHVGAGSNQESIVEFTRNRLAALVKPKRFRKRMKNAPKSHAELCHAANIESERSLFKRFGKHLDSTFVQNVSSEVAANAPIRSGIMLYVNEVRTNSNVGGRISKKLRREKTQVVMIANNGAESKRILRHLRLSQQEEYQDNYEFISLGRDNKDAENSTMVDAVSKFTDGTLKARSNPSVRQRSLEDITNTISSTRRAAVAQVTCHSI